MNKDYEKEIDFSDPNDAHARMVEMVGSGKRVVDFGCWTGFMARALKERGCSVTGIEVDAEAARTASEVCDRVVVADLDEMDLVAALASERYDVGLFGDVIEHLKYPARVLRQMRGLLAPGGCIVLSVPNIAHASIRLMILDGRFDYEETGILDDTHLKFYTRRSACDLLESCGYTVDVVDWTEQKVSEAELRAALDPLGIANLEEVIKAFSTLESVAFQYLIKALPASDEARMQRLAEEKVQAEHRLRTLEKEHLEREKVKQYTESLEEQIDKKNAYIESLEAAVHERDHSLEDKERRARELEQRVAELEPGGRQGRGRRRD